MNWKLLWDLFIVFSRVALFSWGGGPASMGLMQREGADCDHHLCVANSHRYQSRISGHQRSDLRIFRLQVKLCFTIFLKPF